MYLLYLFWKRINIIILYPLLVLSSGCCMHLICKKIHLTYGDIIFTPEQNAFEATLLPHIKQLRAVKYSGGFLPTPSTTACDKKTYLYIFMSDDLQIGSGYPGSG